MSSSGETNRCQACGLENPLEAGSCRGCGVQLRLPPGSGSRISELLEFGQATLPLPPVPPAAPDGRQPQKETSADESQELRQDRNTQPNPVWTSSDLDSGPAQQKGGASIDQGPITKPVDIPDQRAATNAKTREVSPPSTGLRPPNSDPQALGNRGGYLNQPQQPGPQQPGNRGPGGTPYPYNQYPGYAPRPAPPPAPYYPYQYPANQSDAAPYAALPNSYNSGRGPGYGYPYQYYQPQRKQGMAIASMIVGIVSLFFCSGALLVAPIGFVLALVSLSKVKHYPEEYGGKGFAITGLATSSVGMLISLFALGFLVISLITGAH